MLSDPNSGHRALPPVPTIPSGPTLPRLITWAQQVVNWLLKLRDFVAGVPGGFKGTTPNPTGATGDPGTADAGWMAADAIVPQGIVETKGDILTHSATVPAALPIGSNGQVLLVDSTEATGQRWADQSELSQAGGGWARAFMFGSQPDTIFPLRGPNGSTAAPSYSFYAAPSTGLCGDTGAFDLSLVAGGVAASPDGGGVLRARASDGLQAFGGGEYTVAPGAVFVLGHDRSGTDLAGGGLFISAGKGTGTGAGGVWRGQISLAGSGSGTSLNAHRTFLTVNTATADAGAITLGNLSLESHLTPGEALIRGSGRTGTDLAGARLRIGGGAGTGTGNGGDTRILVSPPDASSGSALNADQNALVVSGSDASVSFGGVDIEGSPGTSTWAGADRASGITDGTGGSVTVRAGVGTGSAAASSLAFQTPTVGTTGTSQQTSATRFSVETVGPLVAAAHYLREPEARSVTTAQFDKVNTTLADITGLTSSVLAGRTYAFKAVLFVDADATGGSKFAIAGTATATSIIYHIRLIDDATSAFTITSRETALAGSAEDTGTTAGLCIIEGSIVVNAAGTLTVQFAQQTANGTSSVLIGSYFIVEDMGA